MKLAVISDIHGNRLALEAVLADIARHGADAIVNLGDCLSGPLDPVGTADILMGVGALTIVGNHDRYLRDRAEGDLKSVDRFVAERLTYSHRQWLSTFLPTGVVNGEVFLCHGTPRSDDAPWLDAWWDGRTVTTPTEEDVRKEADGFDFPVLLCGHTHQARAVRLADGRLIMNPGSVGLPVHMGLPDARYAILERSGSQFSVTFHAVPYDWDAAARQAEENGFPQWRSTLTTGWTGVAGLF